MCKKNVCLVFVVLLLSSLPFWMEAQQLQVGAAKKHITPDSPQMLLGYQARQSTGILDSIYHRIVVLDDGSARFYLVSTDICLVSPSEYDRVAGLLQEKYGIDPLHFWWSATHTHSAPEVGPPGLPAAFMGERYTHQYDTSYTNFVATQLIEGIGEAIDALQPARVGVGWGYSRANINRRARDVDNIAFLGMNPDGPVDRRIGLLKFTNPKGQLIALLANYPIHGTVLGGANLHISGDAPGVVSEYVEAKLGAPMLFINGAAGNLAPIYSVYDPEAGSRKLKQFRAMLGDKILAAQEKIRFYTDTIALSFGEQHFETPRREALSWPEDLDAYTRQTPEGENLVRVPVRYLKLNQDIGIWSAPLELFCEISNEVRDRSPFAYTFYYGYTNGWLGYMVTENEYGYKGYEPSVSPFTPEAAADFADAVSGYLEGELRSKNSGR